MSAVRHVLSSSSWKEERKEKEEEDTARKTEAFCLASNMRLLLLLSSPVEQEIGPGDESTLRVEYIRNKLQIFISHNSHSLIEQ